MMGVERTVHDAWSALFRLSPRQHADQSRGGGSQRGINCIQNGGPFAGLFQPA